MNVFAKFMRPPGGLGAGFPPAAEPLGEGGGGAEAHSQASGAAALSARDFVELEASGGGPRRGSLDDDAGDDVPCPEDEAFISGSPVKRDSQTYHFAVDAARLNKEASAVLAAAEKTETAALGAKAAAKAASHLWGNSKRKRQSNLNPNPGPTRKRLATAVKPLPSDTSLIPVGARLRQLSLINAYRTVRPATVDDFHAFLVSLPPGPTGNYWALISALLSVQCRDKVALAAARRFMRDHPGGAEEIATLSHDQILGYCKSCNFCQTKAKNILSVTAEIMGPRHNGFVPQSYEALLSLRGVGPKIAHLLRSVSFGMDSTGIVVDTHVHRIATTLGWVEGGKCTPEDTRIALEKWVPTGEWTKFTLSVVGFGQATRRVDFEKDFLQFATAQMQISPGVDDDINSSSSSVVSTAQDIIKRLKAGRKLKCPWDNSAGQ
eukprot:g2308.t1